jgi:hypothetical protein
MQFVQKETNIFVKVSVRTSIESPGRITRIIDQHTIGASDNHGYDRVVG